MYAVYKYNAGAAVADILNDVVAMLTGESNVNNLSASCDKANSSIIAAEAAGWTLHDANAGTNTKGLKQQVHDDPTKYIYATVMVNTTHIYTTLYESWNETTHVGTNAAFVPDGSNYIQRVSSAGGYLYLRANNRHLVINSYQNGVWGASSYGGFTGIFQRTRRSKWDTVANAYPPAVWGYFGFLTISTNYTFTSPRIANNAGQDVTGSNAGGYIIGEFGSNANGGFPQLPSTTVPGPDKTLKHLFTPFGVMNSPYGFEGGEISNMADIYITTYGYGGALDEVNYNGNTYVVWPVSNYRVVIRKG